MIRVSQWAEIRQQVLVGGVSKREAARRLGVDVKTVRRALAKDIPPLRRVSPRRGRRLDVVRDRMVTLLRQEPRLTAKRMSSLLGASAGPVDERTWREYVAELRAELFPRDAFVHLTSQPGDRMEVDFGDSAAVIGDRYLRTKFLVATLPYSNRHFAKAYPVERLECLMDGIASAFRYFGGVTRRLILDNTSLAVREVLRGPERIENRTFEGFRGQYPVQADFCAPRKGWEKGSVEGGVGYVRDNALRPMPHEASFAALNAGILTSLEGDLDGRRHADGRSVREVFAEEQTALRALPVHEPQTWRVIPKVVDKFGHVRFDDVPYSVPVTLAYRPVICRLHHDRVEIAHDDKTVAVHVRSFIPGIPVIEPRHVLSLLEKKHRAVNESTAIQQWSLPETFHQLRQDLRGRTRKPDQEWVSVLRLLEQHELEDVAAAIEEARARHSPRLETIRALLRRRDDVPREAIPVDLDRVDLAAIRVDPPTLASYDELVEAVR